MKQATNKVKSAKESEVRNDRALQVHELRPSFVRPEDTKHVLTNHFTIELLDILHHFVVTGLEDEAVADKGTTGGKVDQATGDTDDDETKLPPSGKQRLVMTKLIDSTDALKQKKHLYATDKMRHIVSWNTPEDLFQLAAVNAGDTVAQATYTSREAIPRKQLAAVVKDLKLQYKGRIHVSDLVAAATGEKAQFSVELSDTRTIAIDQALNMIITKATMASSMDLFRVASNKIFMENDKKELSPAIFAHHGFYSTIKIGMGAPLLNVSAATSAFYEPLSILGFLKKTSNDCESLKGVKAEISYTEGKTRTIKSFGRSPRDQMFEFGDDDEEISVLAYLRTKNVDENLWI